MDIEQSKQWFKNAKYGMMMHFGLYSSLEGEYKGQRSKVYAEWITSCFRIPRAEMDEIAKNFDPKDFDALKLAKTAKDLGMQYFVMTSKHHDGFCMFNSKVGNFNSYQTSKCHRDFVKEMSDACKKVGLKFGLYYSQDIDWREKDGGGYTVDVSTAPPWFSGSAFYNNWDYTDKQRNYDNCFENKILPQVKELLTNYGDLCLLWFDTPCTINPEQSLKLRNLVKEIQPGCLISSRIGNNLHDYIALEDNEVPDDLENCDRVKFAKFFRNGGEVNLYESACTLNDTWGYSKFDLNYKSPEEIYRIKQKLNKMGVNYLINISPDKLGNIPEQSLDILYKVKELEAKNK